MLKIFVYRKNAQDCAQKKKCVKAQCEFWATLVVFNDFRNGYILSHGGIKTSEALSL